MASSQAEKPDLARRAARVLLNGNMLFRAGLPSLAAAFAVLSCASLPDKPIAATIELQGHRGARGLAPENTWPAFEQAIRHGMNVLELDTVITADGDLVIHHDTETNPALCRTADGQPGKKVAISTLTVAELKTFDCGSDRHEKFPEQQPVPGTRLITLDEFFANIRAFEIKDAHVKTIAFNIEAKFPQGQPTDAGLKRFADLLVGKIRRAGMAKRSTVQSFVPEVLPFARALDKDIRTSALFEPTKWQGLKMYLGLGGGVRADILARAEAVKADIISPYKLYVTGDFLREAHAKKMLVIPWTVNESAEMQQLLQLGVDGIISDYPDRLGKVRKLTP